MKQSELKGFSVFEDRDSCFFPVVCSRFKIPAGIWHGIFRRDWPQRNNVVLRKRFLSRFYEVPFSGCGPLREFATICANVKTYFPLFAEWALTQFIAKFSWMFFSHCWSKSAGIYLCDVSFVGSKGVTIGMLVGQMSNSKSSRKVALDICSLEELGSAIGRWNRQWEVPAMSK